jgi:hypothetical protein
MIVDGRSLALAPGQAHALPMGWDQLTHPGEFGGCAFDITFQITGVRLTPGRAVAHGS